MILRRMAHNSSPLTVKSFLQSSSGGSSSSSSLPSSRRRRQLGMVMFLSLVATHPYLVQNYEKNQSISMRVSSIYFVGSIHNIIIIKDRDAGRKRKAKQHHPRKGRGTMLWATPNVVRSMHCYKSTSAVRKSFESGATNKKMERRMQYLYRSCCGDIKQDATADVHSLHRRMVGGAKCRYMTFLNAAACSIR
jgi:hypothetical protein